MKFHRYIDQRLTNVLVTKKIDGVRAHNTVNGVVSRSGKPLHNVRMTCAVAEVFLGDWESTVSAVRKLDGDLIEDRHIYALEPFVDDRLIISSHAEIGPREVWTLFAEHSKTCEGLVLHAAEGLFKVKGKQSYDVKVTGYQPGRGKHEGRMGALLTDMGKVGTGFTDAQRSEKWPLGCVIEVECMELTPAGKFRHPRFVRRRYDKE